MSQTIGELLRRATADLQRGSIAEAKAAAEILLADLLNLPRLSLFLEAHRVLTPPQFDAYTARLERRLQGEPVQYITGTQEFWSLSFAVNDAVLVPRPETELLVEHGIRQARQWLNHATSAHLLDVGTGSGNIAISLARSVPQSRVWGIDLSREALRVAQCNAQRHAVTDRVRLIQGDLLGPIRDTCSYFALCTANLPYVSTSEWVQLPRDVKDYEPSMALCGGDDGLDLIRRLVVASPGMLAPGGLLLLEVGWKQAQMVMSILREVDAFAEVGVYRDLSGIDRVVWAQKR